MVTPLILYICILCYNVSKDIQMTKRKLKKMIDYDPNTGVIKTECTVTLQHIGFMQIRIDNKNYKLHEMLYIIVHGALPTDGIVKYDNGNKLDNRIDNLCIGYTSKQEVKRKQLANDQAMRDRKITFAIG